MGSRQGILYTLGVSLFRRLAGRYPDRFRRQFAVEILGVLLERLEEVGASGGVATSAFIFHESGALIVSILQERWHEWLGQKERRMAVAGQLDQEIRIVFLKRRLKRIGTAVFLLAALIPLYYGCIYSYAVISIAQAKEYGVFPTLEDAVYSQLGREFQGARVVRVDLNHAEPCFQDGDLPFIWCVSSTTFFDHNPEGSRHSIWRGGYTTLYHLRDGWVFMPGENFPWLEEMYPGLIGRIMEQFKLEGVSN